MNWNLIAEHELSPTLEKELQQLLIAAFPNYTDFFTQHSYWGAKPEFRLFATEADLPIAHLEFGFRRISIGQHFFDIAGIGAVAIHPKYQGKKLGKAMFSHLREYLKQHSATDFGFIGCHEEASGFYEAVGFTRVPQNVYSLNPDSLTWETFEGPTLILPIHKPLHAWQFQGTIHLQGMPW